MPTKYGLGICLIGKKKDQLIKKRVNFDKKEVTISGVKRIRTFISLT